jgi:HEAT repeat protein
MRCQVLTLAKSLAVALFLLLLSVVAVGQNPPPQANGWDFIQKGFTSSDEKARVLAIVAAAGIGPRPEVVQMLMTGTKDRSPLVEYAALMGLGNLLVKDAKPVFQQNLNNHDPALRLASARGLWLQGDTSGRAILQSALSGELAHEQSAVVNEFRSKVKKVPSEFLQMVRNPAAPSGMTGRMVTSFAGPLMIPLQVMGQRQQASQKPAPARVVAAYLLSGDDQANSPQLLVQATHDKNTNVRMAAVRALGQGQASEAVQKALAERMQSDSSKPIRFAAAASLVRLSSSAGKPQNAVAGVDHPMSLPEESVCQQIPK